MTPWVAKSYGTYIINSDWFTMILIVAALALALLAIVTISIRASRRQRTPPELRGDWWSAFEADFRRYARRAEASRRPPKNRANDGSGGA